MAQILQKSRVFQRFPIPICQRYRNRGHAEQPGILQNLEAERTRETEQAREALVARLKDIKGLEVRVVEAGQADGETEPGADNGHADHPGAPGPQQAAAGAPGRQQPDGATRQACDGDARPDRPDDACRRHRPGRERGRHQPQIQRGVGPHGSDPDQVA